MPIGTHRLLLNSTVLRDMANQNLQLRVFNKTEDLNLLPSVIISAFISHLITTYLIPRVKCFNPKYMIWIENR